jgi:hypothetical protein
MKHGMKLVLLAVSVCLLVACRFNPSTGMTFQQFENEWVGSRKSDPIRPVRANGPWTVYETGNSFYYFQNEVLTGTDRGELWASCWSTGFACESINGRSPDLVP